VSTIVSLTEKNFSSNSAFVISISTYTPISTRKEANWYGAVELFLVSLPMVLVVFDGGGKQSVAKRRFSYRHTVKQRLFPRGTGASYLGQIHLRKVSKSPCDCGEGQLPASMTVKAAPRFATILCLSENSVSLPLRRTHEKDTAREDTSGLADWQCQQRALQTASWIEGEGFEGRGERGTRKRVVIWKFEDKGGRGGEVKGNRNFAHVPGRSVWEGEKGATGMIGWGESSRN
jgi:hypothetical protein